MARIGAPARRGAQVALAAAALSAGLMVEALRRETWSRPTIRAEFARELRRALIGALPTVLATAVLVGVGMVYQAISWLAVAGQEGFIGRLVVTVLVRETAPVLVGLILLGRSGTVSIVEFGAIKASGQIRVLQAQGIDPFALLVLPRAFALALAAFTLGILFLLAALITGFLLADLLGLMHSTAPGYFETVADAAQRRDFGLFAAKMGAIGVLVTLVSAITGMSATRRDTPSYLLPRGFVRGILAVLVTSAVLTMAVT